MSQSYNQTKFIFAIILVTEGTPNRYRAKVLIYPFKICVIILYVSYIFVDDGLLQIWSHLPIIIQFHGYYLYLSGS